MLIVLGLHIPMTLHEFATEKALLAFWFGIKDKKVVRKRSSTEYS